MQRLLFVAVAIAAAALGFLFAKSKLPEVQSPPAATEDASARLFGMAVATPEGESTSLKQWTGKILVVNFWASWCAPCREEMPAFSRIQQELSSKNVQFIGIGIDTPDNIIQFRKTLPVSYPLLLGSYEALKLTGDLGNTAGALPFTVILDQYGRIVHSKMGKLEEKELLALLAPLHSSRPQ